MRLTTLEIKGFKSFADKTVIHFNENITGVVGPNGCGKSNVVDAIRWVLGEQKTSQLRSEKMENLIFAGSKKRKPAGLAEVSLTFDNDKKTLPTEFSTVTITRMLFRSGESEYRLNNVPCRLKDITNLFLDTGISSDSYAIIELGMMDEILHNRDQSRRRLLEQAAGISKYKIRKKETLARLNTTETDLNRVEDLLFEIEQNLKQLEKQAKKTKRFYELKEEYKTLSLQLIRLNLTDFKEQFKSVEKQIQDQEMERQKVETSFLECEAALTKLKQETLKQEAGLSARQKSLNELLAKISGLENEKNLRIQRIAHLEETIQTLTKRKTGDAETEKSLRESIDRLKQKLSGLESQVAEKKQKLQGNLQELEQSRLAWQNAQQAAQVAADRLNSIEKDFFEKEKQQAVLQTKRDNLTKEKERLSAEFLSRKESIEGLKKEKTNIDEVIANQTKKVESLIKSEEKLAKELETLIRSIEDARNDLQEENRLLDKKLNEYNLTKSLVDNLEGFPESIRFLKKKAPWLKNAPLLSDIIYCKEEYRITIENYLEPFLNFYVVQSLEDALRCIELLSDSAKGRANFFILEDFVSYQPNTPEIIPESIPATEVVEVDAKYNRLAAYLLDRVYLIEKPSENLSARLDITEMIKNQNDVVFLTLGGKYIRSRFSASGGSVGLFEGLRLGRAKNLEKLKKEVDHLADSSQKKQTRLAELRLKQEKLKQSGKADLLKTERELLNRLGRDNVSISTRLENFESQINKESQRLKDLEDQIAETASNWNLGAEKLSKTALARETLKKELDALQQAAKETSALLDSRQTGYNAENIAFHQFQNQVTALNQEFSYKDKELSELQKRAQNDAEEIARSEKESSACREAEQSLSVQLSELYAQKSQLETGLSDAEAGYFKSRNQVAETEDKQKALSRSLQEKDFLLQELKEKLNELKLSIAGIRERLKIEFNTDINDIINEPAPEGISAEEVNAKVQRMRERIEQFGDINPLAIEAHEEMEKRFQFITEQKNDLMEAKQSLLQTMNEIETVATQQFLDAFYKVRVHFIQVFRTLFSAEDTCDLVLVNEKAPLESDIEITARPKGKKPQTINQLSGGEKTLTALALLFSLYLLKPAPFCIMDEVDAPLDDANIGKFNQTIREYSGNSQFIIVTHNKKTMSSVDVIYGVTMPEQGVSRVVPVDFRSLS